MFSPTAIHLALRFRLDAATGIILSFSSLRNAHESETSLSRTARVFIPNGQPSAETILSNLPGTGSYKVTGQSLTTTTWEAVGLTTGTTAETFDSFAGRYVNSSLSGATLEGGIFSDNSGNPGTLLSTFTNVAIPGSTSTATLFTLNTASSFTMQASTTYWFVVHDTPVQFAWVQDNSTSGTVPTASAGNTFVGYRNTSNSGTAWTTQAAGWPTTPSTFPPRPHPSRERWYCWA